MDDELLRRVRLIEERNSRVELEKAWEVSWIRFWSNTLATYFTMNLLLWTIGDQNPPIHSLVPTIGYVLSTLSLPVIKGWWIGRNK